MLLLVFTLVPLALTQISVDYNCTSYNETRGFTYTSQAVTCQNVLPDNICALLFLDTPGAVMPEEGASSSRPPVCYSTANSPPYMVNDELRQYAIENCPRTCGFCCLTSPYNCQNAYPPRINCATVTRAMCLYPAWRDVLINECPATCGYCDYKSTTPASTTTRVTSSSWYSTSSSRPVTVNNINDRPLQFF
ncbi:unnamed protein product [Caenorhabditis brenneri]